MNKYHILPIFFAIVILAGAGCTTSSTSSEGAVQENTASGFVSPTNLDITLSDVEDRLDNHALVANEEKPLYQLIEAFDGMKYTVDNDYLVEVYIYKTSKKEIMSQTKDELETADSIIYISDNVLFLFHTTDTDKIDSFLKDYKG